ncbi:MAG TPA: cupin domain-containing protein [Nitrososphaeraceae archaeon]|jgi:mannose-6-phosphate isomerase-like protein (cupin superfamily)|nr:cupin domain-containing protein [Nitrososphaeraceae archaeon]
MSNSQIFDLEILLSNFPKSRYFIDVINTSTMEVGLINLKKDQEDTQHPHVSDEIYYVISGRGTIEIDGIKNEVNPGKIIYIPKKIPHLFHATSNELVVLYILA